MSIANYEYTFSVMVDGEIKKLKIEDTRFKFALITAEKFCEDNDVSLYTQDNFPVVSRVGYGDPKRVTSLLD